MVQSLRDKVLLITGASRGIGLAIALRAAREGAKIGVVAKTVEPDPRLPGTIHTAVQAIEAAGGTGLAVATDIRDEAQIQRAVVAIVERFGGIDIVVNNASAIHLSPTPTTPPKRFDLMHAVNTRGTYFVSQACYSYLRNAENPHILNISPPLNLNPRWFAPHLAYSLAKFGMSLCVVGMAEEFRKEHIGVNALWPRTAIATAAVQNLLGGEEAIRRCRRPEIVADAAHWILTQPSQSCTGNFFLDEDVLRQAGVEDLTRYAVEPGNDLLPDFFVD